MRINKLLWGLWGAMIVSMMLRQQADTYMIVALIILPILIVLIDLHEEITLLKEENKHQRKFVMDRYNLIQEKLNELSNQMEKRLVVDFSEFAKNNQTAETAARNPGRIESGIKTGTRRKKRRPPKTEAESRQNPVDFNDLKSEKIANLEKIQAPEEDFEDI